MNFHTLAPRWRGALGFGLAGVLTLLPVALSTMGVAAGGVSVGDRLVSTALLISMLAFGLCGAVGATVIGLSWLMVACWSALFLLVIPLQAAITFLIAPAMMQDYPNWLVWLVIGIPQVFAVGIIGTAAGFVSGGRKMATWGGRAMALVGALLYLSFVLNGWVDAGGSAPGLILERLVAFGAGGWLLGLGAERVSREDTEAALRKAVERS